MSRQPARAGTSRAAVREAKRDALETAALEWGRARGIGQAEALFLAAREYTAAVDDVADAKRRCRT